MRFRLFALMLMAGVGTSAWSSAPDSREPRRNVLFIAVDDLRPSLGCYGDPAARTPAMDRLASGGVLFRRAYCQQAVCSPSRTSLLTGLRPDTTRVYDLKTHFRSHIPNVVTLPQHFRNHGYQTLAFGKIYHNGYDDPQSWSSGSDMMADANPDSHRRRPAIQPPRGKETSGTAKRKRGPAWEAVEVSDDELPDGQIARRAIDALGRLKDQPFFLAVGFYKPHLPFVAPKPYYDLYPPGSLPVPDPETNGEGKIPEIALTNFGELRSYGDIPTTGPLPEGKAAELVRGYYASTSYVDAQIGRVLDELERLGLREKTVVVLWGDHGWHLGDHGLWCKHTNFEAATRSPLIFSVPGTPAAGGKLDALVELVDIYPTLCEAAGVPIPQNLEGTSLLPLLKQPERPWKSAAFSQYPRERKVMGYSVRTDRHRYTEWIDLGTSRTVAAELYDYESDPGETRNLAAGSADPGLTATLSRMLHAGWRAAVPQ